jgi:hypothetical protein
MPQQTMKLKIILCLALVVSGGLAAFSASAADTNSLRIVVVPSKTDVRIREAFSLALRVENPTATNQSVRVMTCSWQDEWQSSNPKIPWGGAECSKNFAVDVEIPPGGAYTNKAQIFIYELTSDKELSFRMGFTPIGSKKTFWSDEIKLNLLPPDMLKQINQATNLLAGFQKSKSVDQLERALRTVEGMPFPGIDKTVEPAVARRAEAKMWLTLLAAIEQSIDTNYDVNNPTNWAAVNLIPPPTAEGMRYPSGVNPKDIKEPEIRAQYEAALKLNDEKIVRANFQTGVRNIELLAVLDVERFFSTYYTTSKEDQSEVENLLHQAKLSPERTQKLKALFEPTKPAGNGVDTNLTRQISGGQIKHVPLDFLADIPSLKDVSLKMSEAELLEIIRQQKLDYTHEIEHGDSIYSVHPKEYVVVIITFRQGHCGGIQRMRD